MSRSLLHDWEYDIERCCRENLPCEMTEIAEDIYNTAYARGKNSVDDEVLDKIRAEIEEVANQEKFYDEKWALGLRHAVKIIDKYTEESGSEK